MSRTEDTLAGKTILMSGGSRGIGLAIALRAARDGANVVLLAKTEKADPRLPGTIHTAVEEIERAGGNGHAVVGDVRDEDAVAKAVTAAAARFGGIDILVNNASAIALDPIGALPMKRFDLMMQINVRGTFNLISAALPYLYKSANPHILTLSPPRNPDPRWLHAHAPYTVSKYAMTMLTLGVAGQKHPCALAANCLWPRTMIATAAIQNLFGGDAALAFSRRPEIMADAAHVIISQPASARSGECLVDEDVLREQGMTDFAPYRFGKAAESDLKIDLFLEADPHG